MNPRGRCQTPHLRLVFRRETHRLRLNEEMEVEHCLADREEENLTTLEANEAMKNPSTPCWHVPRLRSYQRRATLDTQPSPGS